MKIGAVCGIERDHRGGVRFLRRTWIGPLEQNRSTRRDGCKTVPVATCAERNWQMNVNVNMCGTEWRPAFSLFSYFRIFDLRPDDRAAPTDATRPTDAIHLEAAHDPLCAPLAPTRLLLGNGWKRPLPHARQPDAAEVLAACGGCGHGAAALETAARSRSSTRKRRISRQYGGDDGFAPRRAHPGEVQAAPAIVGAPVANGRHAHSQPGRARVPAAPVAAQAYSIDESQHRGTRVRAARGQVHGVVRPQRGGSRIRTAGAGEDQ